MCAHRAARVIIRAPVDALRLFDIAAFSIISSFCVLCFVNFGKNAGREPRTERPVALFRQTANRWLCFAKLQIGVSTSPRGQRLLARNAFAAPDAAARRQR